MSLSKIRKEIKKTVTNPLRRPVKVTGKKRDKVVTKRLEKIFTSEEANKAINGCRTVVNRLEGKNPPSVLSALIDFTLPLHAFRKKFKPDLRFIEKHMNGFSKGLMGDFIRILKGDYHGIHIYFDTKNFWTSGFNGMKITKNEKTITLGDLQRCVSNNKTAQLYHFELLDDVRAYMLRTVELLEQMKQKNY